MLTSRGLPSDPTSVLKAEPGKLDIKRREPSIPFISLPIVEHNDVTGVGSIYNVMIIIIIIRFPDIKRMLISVGRCVIPHAFLGKSVNYTLSCRKRILFKKKDVSVFLALLMSW